MPTTLDRVGSEVKSEDEAPTRVDSATDAFEKFKPKLQFKGTVGDDETEFKAEFRFRSVKDFDPENLQKRQEIRREDGELEYLPNDIADLKNNIDLLYRLKDRWKLPAVRRAWSRPEQRREIISALGKLRTELEKVASKGGKS
jgi:predicted component of type VI protein secretion system